jgi:signal transduction histidine kinase/ActR/RegA family two-component response regulator
VHPDDVQETIHRWKQSVETGKDFQMEHRFFRSDGGHRWHLSRARAMRDADGNVVRWIGSNTDIHDQKLVQQELLRAKERADQANLSKDEFLAVVSHELRTPLTSILGWALVLQDGKLDDRGNAAAVSAIDRNAKVQARLIEDLLDVARMVTGKLALKVSDVEISKVIAASIASVKPAADAKQITIERIIEDGLPTISADSVRLEQVFWNLLSNAIKFSSPESKIEIRAFLLGPDIRVIVTDTGRGIDPAFLPYVFERFRQADSTTTRQHGGLGLGLTIVRYLVEAHGGAVTVASKGIGQGTRFGVSLPVENVPVHHEPFAYPPALVENDKGLAGLRVLTVEDDTDARELVQTILASAGASVIAVPSADEALGELDLGIPDVIVADIGMSGKDGYQLVREIRLRDVRRGGNVPAIALTAYARNEDRLLALKAGFQMYLPKPVDPTGLVLAVARVAAASQKA